MPLYIRCLTIVNLAATSNKKSRYNASVVENGSVSDCESNQDIYLNLIWKVALVNELDISTTCEKPCYPYRYSCKACLVHSNQVRVRLNTNQKKVLKYQLQLYIFSNPLNKESKGKERTKDGLKHLVCADEWSHIIE